MTRGGHKMVMSREWGIQRGPEDGVVFEHGFLINILLVIGQSEDSP